MRSLSTALRIKPRNDASLAGYWEEYQYQDSQQEVANDVGTSWASSAWTGLTDLAKTFIVADTQKTIAKTVATSAPGVQTVYSPYGGITQSNLTPVVAPSPWTGLLNNPLVWAGVAAGAYFMFRKKRR
jgi:hypothetical protein